jgi:hypothetical protein
LKRASFHTEHNAGPFVLEGPILGHQSEVTVGLVRLLYRLQEGLAMTRYIVSTEERMLDVVERLLVERGVVIVSRDEMFDTLVIETNDPLTVSQIEGVLEIRVAP